MRHSHFQASAGTSLTLRCFLLCLIPAISWGQQPSSPDALVQSLLAEIRQFRLALERSASLLPRMQLAMSRFQYQQQRVDRIAEELKNFRSQMTANASTRDSMAAQIKELESEAQIDPGRRIQVEMVKKNVVSQIEMQAIREQQERVQELELSSQLQTEQAKLDDLTEQLNALDKKLQQWQ